MADVNFTTEQIQDLLKDIGAELQGLGKSAIDDAPSEQSEGSAPPTEPDMSDAGEASASPGADAEETPGEDQGPGEEAPGEPGPDASAEGSEPQGPPSVEELKQHFLALGQQEGPEAIETYMLAARAAYMEMTGGDASGQAPPEAAPPGPEASAGPPAPGPEASAPAPAAPEASASPPPPAGGSPPPAEDEMAMKKEFGSGHESGGEITRKSEAQAELEALRAQVRAQDEALLELTRFVATPVRKSVKAVSELKFLDKGADLAKSEARAKLESMTPDQVKTKLKSLIRSGKLTKSEDKDLVLKYSCGDKSVDISQIEHLLVEAAK